MKVKDINIRKSRKIGLPNYSSVEVGASVTIEVEEGDDKESVFKQGNLVVQGFIDAEMAKYLINDEVEVGKQSVLDKRRKNTVRR